MPGPGCSTKHGKDVQTPFRPSARDTLALIRGSPGRWSVVVLAALLAPVLGAEPASAGRFVDRTVTALRSGPIYVDPHAEYKPYPSEVQEIRRRIRSSHAGPLHVAVLPARAAKEGGGSARALAGVLRRRLGRQGTYAVVAGADFGAASSDLPPGEAERLARAASSAHRDQGVGPTPLDFVDRVGDAKSGRSPGGGGGGGIPTGAVVAILAAVAAAAALGALVRRRRRTARGCAATRTRGVERHRSMDAHVLP